LAGNGRLDIPRVSGVASELSRYLVTTSAAWFGGLWEVSHERQVLIAMAPALGWWMAGPSSALTAKNFII
jgi:hypothetical protein